MNGNESIYVAERPSGTVAYDWKQININSRHTKTGIKELHSQKSDRVPRDESVCVANRQWKGNAHSSHPAYKVHGYRQEGTFHVCLSGWCKPSYCSKLIVKSDARKSLSTSWKPVITNTFVQICCKLLNTENCLCYTLLSNWIWK